MLLRFQICYIFVLPAFLVELILADICYYPNGNLVIQEPVKKCQNSNVCCPLNWVCVANGLCFNPKEQIYGRYSCANKDRIGCPNFCSKEFDSAGGDQAVLQCPHNKLWCCDGNRVSMNCCSMSGTTYLALGNIVIDTAANISSPAPVIVAPDVKSEPSTTSKLVPTRFGIIASSSTARIFSSNSTTSAPISSSSQTSDTFQSNMSVITNSVSQTSDASQSNTPAPSSKKSFIIGLTVGLILSVVGFINLIVVIRKLRSKQRSQQQKYIDHDDSFKPERAMPPNSSLLTPNELLSPKGVGGPSVAQTNSTAESGIWELDAAPVSVVPGRLELHGNSSTFELSGESSKHEMDAGNTNSAPSSPVGARQSSEERRVIWPSQPLSITC